MKRGMLGGVLIGVAVATSGAVVAGFATRDGRYAEVIEVQPVLQDVRLPRMVCGDQTVEKQRPVQDQQRVAGTAVGAVLGGVIGHQIGNGNGRTLAMIAGAAAGGYAGNRAQQHLQQHDTYKASEKRCHTVQDVQQDVVGYDVRYRLGDTVDVVRMKQRPGGHIPVRDGRLLIEDTGKALR